MITVTARKFYDIDFVGDSGGGTTVLQCGITNHLKAVIDFYYFLGIESKPFEIAAATKTITIDPTSFFYDFIQNGWKVGMSIEIDGTGSNDGTYTITAVTNDTITVAESLTDESVASGNIYDITAVDTIEFFYNLVRNNIGEDYISLTDTNAIQRYRATGLDASDTVTTVNFKIHSGSNGWVTNAITNIVTNETNEVTIIGMGISGRKQSFRITQKFIVAPVWLREQLNNYLNAVAPDYLLSGNSLKHVFKCVAKKGLLELGDGGITDENGLVAWLNATGNGGRPDNYINQLLIL